MAKLNTEEFIAKAKAVHGDRYDYSKVEYVGIYSKVCIICPDHGEFMQVARQHLKGIGCPNCAGHKTWDYHTCYESAKKYRTRNEFKNKEVGAYTRALKQGWLKDYVWFDTPKTGQNKWPKDRCYEEARKYKSEDEFRKWSNYAYCKAKKRGWIDDYTWFVVPNEDRLVWTEESVYNEAQKYHNKTEFRRNCFYAFNLAKKKGWLKDYTWFPQKEIVKVSWTRESCYEEAKRYNTKAQFEKGCPSAYNKAKANGWFSEYTWFENGHVLEGAKRRKWTYETCYEAAKKFTKRNDFLRAKGFCRAYKVARANGWLEDYTWFEEFSKPAGYWNYEKCYEEAQKYDSLLEFRKKCPSACVIARRNGWLEKYDWLIKRRNRWTYIECYELAKCFTSRTDFKKAHLTAYQASLENEWINDYTWFKSKPKYRYWTQQKCYEEAKKYSSKKEFAENNSSAYSIACKNGWIADYDWQVDRRIEIYHDKIDCVYSYYFKETNTIYIGRTINPKDRDYQHIFMTDRDSVAKYAQKIGCEVPPMIILEDCLTLKEGQEKEDYWKNFYEDMGYNILNKAATGVGRSSLGAIGFGKWKREACFEEAKKYASRSEFKEGNGSAYSAASKRGWLKDYTWFEELKIPESYWTYERCYEEAKKCVTLKEFYRGHNHAYKAAKKKGWTKDYTWFIAPSPQVKWTYEACLEKAKTCKSKVEFETKYSGAMNVARRNNWLKEYTWFERPAAKNLKWTYEACKAEASKYASRGEFLNGSKTAYFKSSKNGWLDEFFPNKKK
jgi:hypothetical protein